MLSQTSFYRKMSVIVSTHLLLTYCVLCIIYSVCVCVCVCVCLQFCLSILVGSQIREHTHGGKSNGFMGT